MAVAKSSLRILMVERLGEAFNQTAVRLRYTPRAFALDAVNRSIYVAEADHAAVPLAERPDAGGAAPMEDGQAGLQVPPPQCLFLGFSVLPEPYNILPKPR